MVPLVTRETLFGKHVSKLVFGVNIVDLDLRFQVNSVEQPVKRKSVGSGYMSLCWTSAFDNHLEDSLVVLKDVQHRTKSRKLRVRQHTVNIVQIKIVVLGWNLGFVLSVLV